MNNWQKVYTSSNPLHANLVRDVLETNGLKAFLMDKKDSSYGMFGQLEVYVDKKQVVTAIKIIEDEVSFK